MPQVARAPRLFGALLVALRLCITGLAFGVRAFAGKRADVSYAYDRLRHQVACRAFAPWRWFAVVFATVVLIGSGMASGAAAVPNNHTTNALQTLSVNHGYDSLSPLSTGTHPALITTTSANPNTSISDTTDTGAPRSTAATGVAAEPAGQGLSFSEKIAGQLGERGWTEDSVTETVENPITTHSVWDYTTGEKQPASAYVTRGGATVVTNDDTKAVVQISDLNKPNWKPVWDDPRFQG